MRNNIYIYIYTEYIYCISQGLFRIAAGSSKLKKLKAALDCSTSQLEEFYSDPHAVAGTIHCHDNTVKTRDAPIPIFLRPSTDIWVLTEYRYEYLIIPLQFKEQVFHWEFTHYDLFWAESSNKEGDVIAMVTVNGSVVIHFWYRCCV